MCCFSHHCKMTLSNSQNSPKNTLNCTLWSPQLVADWLALTRKTLLRFLQMHLNWTMSGFLNVFGIR